MNSCILFLALGVIVQGTSRYDGILLPAKQAVIHSLSGGVAIAVPCRAGQTISRGALICAMDATKDSLNLILAQRKLERSRIEHTGEIENEIAVRLQEIACDEKRIVAPFAGTVTKIMAREHEYYSAGTIVAEIADLASLTTELHVSLSDLKRLLAAKASITVSRDGREVAGSLHAHIPVADPGVETFPVTIIFVNKHHWPAGAAVTVVF